MKILHLLLIVLTFHMAGCDKDIRDELPLPGGEVKAGVPFTLPGPVLRMESYFSGGHTSQMQWRFVQSDWKPKGWSLWIASNAYSAYEYARDNPKFNAINGSGLGRAAAPWDRAEQDGKFIRAVKGFVKENNVPVEINFLGYDEIPETLIKHDEQWSRGGRKFSYNYSECNFAFHTCINNYYVSPVTRYSNPNHTSFKEWVTPYIHFKDGDVWGPDNLKAQIGQDGENSVFYDWWPTMVFLVDPEGKVARAWLPQTQSTASVNRVISALVYDMDLDGPIIFKPEVGLDHTSPIKPSEWAYYGEYFIDAGVRRLGSAIERAIDQ